MDEVGMTQAGDWGARLEEMLAFVGVTEEDRQLIRDSGPIVNKHARRLNDLVYDHILEYPEAGKFFRTEDGKPDDRRIELNKQTMVTWLQGTATAPTDPAFARYLAAVSLMHKNTPLHRPHLTAVPSRYVIGTISFYQTAIADLLSGEMSDPDLVARTSAAWNKLLMVELDLLLSAYLTDSKT